MKKETYNGWTNYATWRVNLEIFDGLTPEDITGRNYITKENLEHYADEIVTEGATDLCASYARAFISEVNFYEIAEHINSSNDE